MPDTAELVARMLAGDPLPEQTPKYVDCLFTSANGKRCRNPVFRSYLGLCALHENLAHKRDDIEVRAVSEVLLGGPDAELRSRDEVSAALSRLFVLVSQKRISRKDGTLLAYIGSLILQSLPVAPT